MLQRPFNVLSVGGEDLTRCCSTLETRILPHISYPDFLNGVVRPRQCSRGYQLIYLIPQHSEH